MLTRSPKHVRFDNAVFKGPLPWDQHMDKAVTCDGAEQGMDLGVHTNASCLSAVDLGVNFGWYPGTTYAVWRGDSNKHCQLCSIKGNSSDWKYNDQTGAISYTKIVAKAQASYEAMMKYDHNGDGMIDEYDLKASMGPNLEKKEEDEAKDEDENKDDGKAKDGAEQENEREHNVDEGESNLEGFSGVYATLITPSSSFLVNSRTLSWQQSTLLMLTCGCTL